MRILFVDFSKNIYDKHPVYTLSAILKKNGHTVKYLAHENTHKSQQFFQNYQPELVLYSLFSSEIFMAVDFDRELKKYFSFHSIAGGPGPTYDRKEIKDSTIDAVGVGEAELAIIHYIENGFIPNQNIFPRNGSTDRNYFPMADLDTLPFPDREVIYEQDAFLKNMPSKQFMAGRGCPYHCTYCHNHAFIKEFEEAGPKFRYKTVDYLIAEIKDVVSKYPLQNIVFQDDVFILDKKWLREFCDKYPKEVGLPFTCNIRANLINDDIVKLLKDSGCVGASWSIESGNDHIRNKILYRNMSRKVILRAAELLNKYGLRHRTGNILGIPGETYEEMLETLEINIEVQPYLAMAYTFVPFPGLALTEYAVKNGHLSPELVEYIPRTFFKKSVLNFDEDHKDKIERLGFLFPTLVKFPSLYYNKPVFEFLMSCNSGFLKLIYHYSNILYTSRMFKVKMTNTEKAQGFLRYLRSGM